MSQRPTFRELFDVLLRAIWSNKLSIQITNETQDQRQPLLRIVNIARNQPGIVFYERESDLPPEKAERADGSAEYDIRKRIYLPRNELTWTSAIIADACVSLASCTFNDYEPDPVRITLSLVGINRKAFAAFCDAQGYPRPDFWFSAKEQKKGAKLPSFPGRSSVMREILAEFHRRAAAGELAPKLIDEARALRRWAEKYIEKKHQIPGEGAIQNAIRAEYWQLRRKPPPNP